ncbi:MAG: family four-helix-bundle protein [Gammaproteobacteria bacterium]|nr:family four-helix-bundle protein [Gammaproteobacteria bacterium]
MPTDQTSDALNNLLSYLYDSHNGYKECSDEVSDIKLKNLFQDMAQKRANMIADIKQIIPTPLENTTRNGSITGVLHRTYIDLKSLLTDGDTQAIVEEVKVGENATINKYEQILNQNLPESVKQLLQKQLNEIKNNLTMIEAIAST